MSVDVCEDLVYAGRHVVRKWSSLVNKVKEKKKEEKKTQKKIIRKKRKKKLDLNKQVVRQWNPTWVRSARHSRDN